jgi:AcrR family transcriptional regulator
MKKISPVSRKDVADSLQDSPSVHVPPGGVKIVEALKNLLKEKSFDAITTAEISRVAGVNEALIYRYFKDKRGLLHKVLADYTLEHLLQIQSGVNEADGALNKLKALMRGTIAFHKRNRLFSKILLLEVRNYPGYFESDAYDLVRQYASLIDNIVEDGMRTGEIRDDIPLVCMKDVIVGSIEHACLRAVVFDRNFDEESLSRNLTEAVIGGLAGRKSRKSKGPLEQV